MADYTRRIEKSVKAIQRELDEINGKPPIIESLDSTEMKKMDIIDPKSLYASSAEETTSNASLVILLDAIARYGTDQITRDCFVAYALCDIPINTLAAKVGRSAEKLSDDIEMMKEWLDIDSYMRSRHAKKEVFTNYTDDYISGMWHCDLWNIT